MPMMIRVILILPMHAYGKPGEPRLPVPNGSARCPPRRPSGRSGRRPLARRRSPQVRTSNKKLPAGELVPQLLRVQQQEVPTPTSAQLKPGLGPDKSQKRLLDFVVTWQTIRKVAFDAWVAALVESYVQESFQEGEADRGTAGSPPPAADEPSVEEDIPAEVGKNPPVGLAPRQKRSSRELSGRARGGLRQARVGGARGRGGAGGAGRSPGPASGPPVPRARGRTGPGAPGYRGGGGGGRGSRAPSSSARAGRQGWRRAAPPPRRTPQPPPP